MKVWMSLFLFLVVSPAFAEKCFVLSAPSAMGEDTEEVWCYREFTRYQSKFRLVYNNDGGLKPELSFLQLLDQRDQVMFTSHAFSSNGETQFMVEDQFSPIPDHVDFEGQQQVIVPFDNSASAQQVVDQMMENLFVNSVELSRRSERQSRRSEEQARVPNRNLPWRGYWWPMRRLEMAKNEDSPLAKFDRYVRSELGERSSAFDWERRVHGERTSWSGHCNGWAAASILAAEPKRDLAHFRSGEVITPLEQKAWQIEAHFCTKIAFYGERYRDESDNPEDIAPHRFHRLLKYYIKRQGKPVVIDINPKRPVFNHVVSGYSSQIRRSSRRMKIITTLDMHKYDDRKTSRSGVAQRYQRKYKYEFKLDDRGRVVDSRWISREHPDFLWVPLAPSDCGGNPHVTHSRVNRLLRN